MNYLLRLSFTGSTTAGITGTLLNLGNYPLSIGGSTSLSLSEPPSDARPGVRSTERFAPLKSSYKEIPPPKETAPVPSGDGDLLEPVM